jgi:predicted RND superfamily exporter protein
MILEKDMNIIKRMGLTNMVGVLILSLLGCVTHLATASSLPQVSVQLWSVKNEVKADVKGTLQALANLAKRRAISVLPTPVGPIIRMFLGVTS